SRSAAAESTPGSGKNELLTDANVGAAQVIRPLDPPDPVADVTAVTAGRDRPQRVVRTNRHHLAGPVRVRGARDRAPGQNGDSHDESDPNEHMFATLANRRSCCQVP